MSFKRDILPSELLTGDELSRALISIGVRLSGEPSLKNYNIEDVLFSASIEGVCGEDYRVLGLLVDWIQVHGKLINVDRLSKLVEYESERKLRAFWNAVSHWQAKDSRFKKLAIKSKVKGRIELLSVGSSFLIKKNGEDNRFKDSALIVPDLTLRHRVEDIQTRETLAKMNVFYKFRLMIGPSYRADVWAYLQTNKGLTASELAKLSYSSFATAWGVKRDFEVLNVVEIKSTQLLLVK